METLKVIRPVVSLNGEQRAFKILEEPTYPRVYKPKTQRSEDIKRRNHNQYRLAVRASGYCCKSGQKDTDRNEIVVETRYALLGDHIEMLPRSIVFLDLGHFLHNAKESGGYPIASPIPENPSPNPEI